MACSCELTLSELMEEYLDEIREKYSMKLKLGAVKSRRYCRRKYNEKMKKLENLMQFLAGVQKNPPPTRTFNEFLSFVEKRYPELAPEVTRIWEQRQLMLLKAG